MQAIVGHITLQITGVSGFPPSVAAPLSTLEIGGQTGQVNAEHMTGGHVGGVSGPPASFATLASGGGAQTGQVQGSGFGRYPPTQSSIGHAIRQGGGPSGFPPSTVVPPSTGAQMRQPQESVLSAYPIEHGGPSIGQSTSSQYDG